jgi:hypothetical protein
MDKLDLVLNFGRHIALTTVSQAIALVGIFFVFGIVLYVLARFTRRAFVCAGLRKLDVYLTGWIGTPVHEFGHAAMCPLFLHKICEVKFFTPDDETGTLGYVAHTYNPANPWSRIGNLFIGAGPIIIGAIALYAALHYLAPNKEAVFGTIDAQAFAGAGALRIQEQAGLLLSTIPQTLQTLFSPENLRHWPFYVFLYLSICISSHMELSPPDIKGMLSGLWALLAVLAVINIAGVVAGFDAWTYIVRVNQYVGMFVGLFVFAVIMSAMNFVLSTAAMNAYTLTHGRGVCNPFR